MSVIVGWSSESVSLANKFAVPGSFLVVETKSLPADGGAFSLGLLGGVTVNVTVASSVAPLGSMIP